jgi:hypothetical protein
MTMVLKSRKFAKYIISNNTNTLSPYNNTRLFNTDFTFGDVVHLVINLFNENLENIFCI